MRLLIADDHNLVREAIASYLSRAASDITCVEAADLEGARERLSQNGTFDVVVLDYNMPGMNGLAGLDEVRALAPATPVAIRSGTIDRSTAVQALERGASGILMKDLRGTALLVALRLIAAGEIYVPPALIGPTGAGNPADGRIREMRATLGRLTTREFECVRLLAGGKPNREIGEALGIADTTVKLHLNSAFKKMGARSRADAVRIAFLKGVDAL